MTSTALRSFAEQDQPMTYNIAHCVDADRIQTWRHGKSRIPDWVSPHMVGDIAANGTFIINALPGRIRVHPGSIIIERSGDLWVCAAEEYNKFMENLRRSSSLASTNIGPGKTHQFGAETRKKGPKRENRSAGHHARYVDPLGTLPTIEWIHLDRLSVDHAYQRSTENEASSRLIMSIAAKFDWRLCAPLVVSRRADEALTIIDGQHRWMAARERGDIPQLPCCVFRYGNMEEEARMFILANRARKPINRLDDFHAALTAADEDAIEIQQLVTDAGLRVARTTSSAAWRPGDVAFTSSIAKAIRKYGPAVTSAALTNMAEAFGEQRLSHGSAIFGGLVRILCNPKPDFDPDRLLSVLQTRTADTWGGHAAGLRGGDRRVMALQNAILQAYEAQTSGADIPDSC